jgi:hypothetical protein
MLLSPLGHEKQGEKWDGYQAPAHMDFMPLHNPFGCPYCQGFVLCESMFRTCFQPDHGPHNGQLCLFII